MGPPHRTERIPGVFSIYLYRYTTAPGGGAVGTDFPGSATGTAVRTFALLRWRRSNPEVRPFEMSSRQGINAPLIGTAVS